VVTVSRQLAVLPPLLYRGIEHRIETVTRVLNTWDFRFIDRYRAKTDSGQVMEERRKNQPGRGERRSADANRIADALKRRGRISMYVQGSGMLPLVRPGDVALIRRDKLENMRSGDVVLFQRGNHLLAKRIGEDDDLAADRELEMDGENYENSSSRADEQECLGQIVRLRRKAEEIDLTSKETPISALVSKVLRPARRLKESLQLSDGASG
jgi:hypothetical protein